MATCGGCSSPARRQGTGTWASCRFSTRATPALPLRFRCTSRAQAIPSRKCNPSLPPPPLLPRPAAGGGGGGGGKGDPMAAAPAILPGRIGGGVESFYVVVGTGKYLESRDSVSTTQQTVYAIYDNGTRATDGASRASATRVITGRSRLRAGTVDKDGRKVTVSAFQWGRPMAGTQTARAGWSFDLPVTGERVAQAALDLGALTVAINSKIPGSTATGAASCANAMGGGNQYVLSIDNGAGTYVPSPLGLLGPPVLQASDGDARVSPSDSTGQRIRTVTLHRFTQAQGGIDSSAPPVTISETIGRLSWRQVFNYLDLKNASP